VFLSANTSYRTHWQYSILFVSVVLLVLAASRIIKFNSLEMNTDEVWSIWQTFGTPEQILRWTPYDWPPLYYLVLGGWKELVGFQPYVLRVFSLLCFLPAVAVLYRIIRRLRDERTALMVVLAFSALGYVLRISTEVRAYMLMIEMLIFAFWFLLRYFDYPSIVRAIPLALTMTIMFYSYLPSVIGFAMLGVYTLVVYPRKVWCWWLPGLIALLLALPLIIDKIPDAAVRLAATDQDAPKTLIEGIADYFHEFTVFEYADYPVVLWAGIFAVASLTILMRRKFSQSTWAFFLWAAGLPVVVYLVNPLFKFSGHYSMSLMVGIAVWVGWGLAYLPRQLYRLAAFGFLILIFFPFQLHYFDDFWRPLTANFEWLSDRLQPGDVVLIDPNKGVDKYYEWAYASKLYFPNGLQFVTDPEGYRRVWYITFEGKRDPATDEAVRRGRVEREFVGPARFFFRLYEAPPDPVGILFNNGMRFHGIDMLDSSGHIALTGPLTTHHDYESFRVRLWWSVDHPLTADYSVGTYLIWRGQLINQVDGAPQTVSLEYPPNIPPSQTSQWITGRYYIEERELHIPDFPDARPQVIDLDMAVYQWWDNTRISATEVDNNLLLFLKRLFVETW
jgi:hypothetical protein